MQLCRQTPIEMMTPPKILKGRGQTRNSKAKKKRISIRSAPVATPTKKPEGKFYNLAEVAKFLGVLPATVTRKVRERKLAGFREGNDWKFKTEDVHSHAADKNAPFVVKHPVYQSNIEAGISHPEAIKAAHLHIFSDHPVFQTHVAKGATPEQAAKEADKAMMHDARTWQSWYKPQNFQPTEVRSDPSWEVENLPPGMKMDNDSLSGEQPSWPQELKTTESHNQIRPQGRLDFFNRKAAIVSPDNQLYDVGQLGSTAIHNDIVFHSPHLFGDAGSLRDALEHGTIRVVEPMSMLGTPTGQISYLNFHDQARSPKDIVDLIDNGILPNSKKYVLDMDRHTFGRFDDIPQEKLRSIQDWEELHGKPRKNTKGRIDEEITPMLVKLPSGMIAPEADYPTIISSFHKASKKAAGYSNLTPGSRIGYTNIARRRGEVIGKRMVDPNDGVACANEEDDPMQRALERGKIHVEQRYEPEPLDGEHWLDENGQAMYADGDIGDMNHEGYAQDQAIRDVASAFGVDAGDEYADIEDVHNKIVDKHPDMERIFEEDDMPALQAKLEKLGLPEETWHVAHGAGDSRLWAAKQHGWTRMAGNSLQTVGIDSDKMKNIANGIADAHSHRDDLDDQKFDLEVVHPDAAGVHQSQAFQSRLYQDVPMSVLDSGDMNQLRKYDSNYQEEADEERARSGAAAYPEVIRYWRNKGRGTSNLPPGMNGLQLDDEEDPSLHYEGDEDLPDIEITDDPTYRHIDPNGEPLELEPEDAPIASFNRFDLQLPRAAVEDISRPGPADEAVDRWAPNIPRSKHITPEKLAAELKDYGAWEPEELADDEANWQRIIWQAALEIRDQERKREEDEDDEEDEDGDDGGGDEPPTPLPPSSPQGLARSLYSVAASNETDPLADVQKYQQILKNALAYGDRNGYHTFHDKDEEAAVLSSTASYLSDLAEDKVGHHHASVIHSLAHRALRDLASKYADESDGADYYDKLYNVYDNLANAHENASDYHREQMGEEPLGADNEYKDHPKIKEVNNLLKRGSTYLGASKATGVPTKTIMQWSDMGLVGDTEEEPTHSEVMALSEARPSIDLDSVNGLADKLYEHRKRRYQEAKEAGIPPEDLSKILKTMKSGHAKIIDEYNKILTNPAECRKDQLRKRGFSEGLIAQVGDTAGYEDAAMFSSLPPGMELFPDRPAEDTPRSKQPAKALDAVDPHKAELPPGMIARRE